ncbi:expressed unknown protein [Seminavis robusta]|uniref:Uncharacterized protein n=1 Tax=Seminavis robusta TaxID=568900 RepID=A0A9N8F257_9STRA|nr:expressed unknown protein [Seminavis robusta]|eukprot:Sro2935_g340540.1 n/a (209) ;mRNA; f:3016-3710
MTSKAECQHVDYGYLQNDARAVKCDKEYLYVLKNDTATEHKELMFCGAHMTQYRTNKGAFEDRYGEQLTEYTDETSKKWCPQDGCQKHMMSKYGGVCRDHAICKKDGCKEEWNEAHGGFCERHKPPDEQIKKHKTTCCGPSCPTKGSGALTVFSPGATKENINQRWCKPCGDPEVMASVDRPTTKELDAELEHMSTSTHARIPILGFS